MLLAAMGVVIGLLLVVAFLIHAAGRARARALADAVRGQIAPYVLRQAAAAGICRTAPTWTRRHHPEEIVAYSSGLARRLLDRERTGATGPHDSLELARTQPAEMGSAGSPAMGMPTHDMGKKRKQT